MIGKVKINTKGNKIAEIEIKRDECGNLLCLSKKNVKAVYSDMEQTEQGFVEVLDIDLE